MIAENTSICSSRISPREGLTVFFLLQVAAFAVYSLALTNGFLNWDDPAYIVNNAAAHGFSIENIRAAFSNFYVGNYAPVQILSYMLDYTFWGLNPSGYTFQNIFLHATNGFLLFLLLRRFSLEPMVATIAALFFVLHPVQAETVIWLSQRKTLLAMLFFLLALIYYKEHRDGDKSVGRDYLLSLVFFVAALLAKSVVVVFPVMIMLYDFCVARRRLTSAIVAAIPFAACAFIIALISMMSQSEDYGGGGRTEFHGGGKLATFFTMLPVFVTYLRMIVAPYNLSIVYAPILKHSPDAAVIGSALFLTILAIFAVWLYRRSRIGFFWYVSIPVAILPVSQLVPLVTMMNDRYLYFPLLGVSACLGLGIANLLKSNRRELWITVSITALLLCAVYGYFTFERAKIWRNSLTLWQDAADKQSGSAVAWLVLGELYDGRDDDATFKSFSRAKELCKGVECFHVYEKLSLFCVKTGKYALAEEYADFLIANFPKNANGYISKGYLSYRNDKLALAEKMFLAGVKLDPNQPSALHALGNIYLASGQTTLAKDKLLATYKLGNPSPDLYYSLACVESLLLNHRAALNYLESALRLGYNNFNLIMTNKELASTRKEADFATLMGKYFPVDKAHNPKGGV